MKQYDKSSSAVPAGHLHDLLYLAPFVAGLAVGILVIEARGFPELAQRFWPGAGPAPQGLSQAGRILTLAVSAGAAVALWLALSALLARGAALGTALKRYAPPFLPFVSILLLFAIDRQGIAPGIMLFSIHALILSAAAFLGILAGIEAAREEPPLGRLVLRIDSRALLVVGILAAIYWATFSTLGILQYNSLNISCTDTADWEQMLWNTMRGRFLQTSAFEHMFFGEHVQFVHLFLLPFYVVFPSLKTLMVLKSAALASGAFPVYLLSRNKVGSKAAAVFFAATYLLYPAMQYVDLELVYNTFRPVAFAIPALLWAVYFLDRERMVGFCVAAFFALASKEEMALPVAMMGLLLLFRRKWAWGAAVFALAASWFLASVLWVIPHFRGGPVHMFRYYSDFGENLTFGSLLVRIVSDPIHTLGVIFRPVKIDYLLLLLVPLGLRTLFSWRMIFVMLPSLATTLLASRDPSFRIHFHYQAALVPFMVMGAVLGARNCAAFVPRIGLLFAAVPAEVRRRAVVAGLSVLVAASALFANLLFAQSPLSLLFYNRNMETYWRNRYAPDERTAYFFREVRPLVPADASVSATEFAATCFAARRDDYVFPLGVGKADYIVVDTRDRWLGDDLAGRSSSLEEILGDGRYELIHDGMGFLVYRMRPLEGQGAS